MLNSIGVHLSKSRHVGIGNTASGELSNSFAQYVSSIAKNVLKTRSLAKFVLYKITQS